MPDKAISVPQDFKEATLCIRAIGREQRALAKIETELNARIAQLKTIASTRSGPRVEKIAELFEALHAYAEAHRDELTKNGKRKTVSSLFGTLGWRMTPPAVRLRNIKSVLKYLKENGLECFIRTKEEVDKEAMLADPDTAQTIRGVSIGQHEEFVVTPDVPGQEISKRVKNLTKKIS